MMDSSGSLNESKSLKRMTNCNKKLNNRQLTVDIRLPTSNSFDDGCEHPSTPYPLEFYYPQSCPPELPRGNFPHSSFQTSNLMSSKYSNNLRQQLQSQFTFPPDAFYGNHPGNNDFQVSQAAAYDVSQLHEEKFDASTGPVNSRRHPAVHFDPQVDAQLLQDACNTFGFDENIVVQVLASRTSLQRQEIADHFSRLYRRDLVELLRHECTGNFEKLLVAMMTPVAQFYAKELYEAVCGAASDGTAFVEAMFTMSHQQLLSIYHAYQFLYGKTLEEDLRAMPSGSFSKRLMVSLCSRYRDQSSEVDPEAAFQDARRLFADERTLHAILSSRSFPHLALVFNEYHRIVGQSVEQTIQQTFPDSVREHLFIVSCIRSPIGFFADQLHSCFQGTFVVNHEKLIRLVATRSEMDLKQINEHFKKIYHKSLEDFILLSSTSIGSYEKCLLTLIR